MSKINGHERVPGKDLLPGSGAFQGGSRQCRPLRKVRDEMFRKQSAGYRLIFEALKTAGADFLKIARQTGDLDEMIGEAERHENFAQSVLARVDAGEMDEKYSQIPGALEKLFKQVTHATILGACLRLFITYERSRRNIYGA
jgi:hypothetical protein